MIINMFPVAAATTLRIVIPAAIAVMAATPAIAGGGGEPEQVFLLDFDTFFDGGPFDHDYTAAERDQIANEMSAHFVPFNMSVTQAPPPAGEYSTIFFNGPGPGGSDGIDFRNVDKSDTARLNARMLLEVVGIANADQTAEMIVRTSINTGMHEGLHLVGARHQDAYAPPGSGLPFPALAGSYTPPYPGPVAAPFTDQTFQSLTLVLGLSAEKQLQEDMFISPRTALKAMLGENVPVTERQPGNVLPPDAQFVTPTILSVPNTLPPGLELPPGFSLPNCVEPADLEFITTVAIVKGVFSEPFQLPHYYEIPNVASGNAVPLGYTVEVFSEVLEHRLTTPVNTALWVLDPGPDYYPVDYYGVQARNDDGIETGDPAIIDLAPPPYDTFIVEVWPEQNNNGEYELIIYGFAVIIPPGNPPADINCDGVVGVSDLLAVIGAWGPCPGGPPPQACPADIAPPDGDGVVGVSDLLLVIANWS